MAFELVPALIGVQERKIHGEFVVSVLEVLVCCSVTCFFEFIPNPAKRERDPYNLTTGLALANNRD